MRGGKSRDIGCRGIGAGGENHGVGFPLPETFRRPFLSTTDFHIPLLQLTDAPCRPIPINFLVRRTACRTELTAGGGLLFENLDLVPAAGGGQRGGEARGSRPDHPETLRLGDRNRRPQIFPAAGGIEGAGHRLHLEAQPFDASLVAGDAPANLREIPGLGLCNEVGIGQVRTAEADQVGSLRGERLLCRLRPIDPADADYRHARGLSNGSGPEEVESLRRVHRSDAEISRRGVNAHRAVDHVGAGGHELRGQAFHELQVIAAADQFVC